MSSNRRKTRLPLITVASTSTSGATAVSDHAANADAVLFLIALASIAAGSITFSIQIQEETSGTWHSLTTAEMTGDTGALTAAGNYHVSAKVPFGTRIRLRYVIVTGPVEFDVAPIFERTASVYG